MQVYAHIYSVQNYISSYSMILIIRGIERKRCIYAEVNLHTVVNMNVSIFRYMYLDIYTQIC